MRERERSCIIIKVIHLYVIGIFQQPSVTTTITLQCLHFLHHAITWSFCRNALTFWSFVEALRSFDPLQQYFDLLILYSSTSIFWYFAATLWSSQSFAASLRYSRSFAATLRSSQYFASTLWSFDPFNPLQQHFDILDPFSLTLLSSRSLETTFLSSRSFSVARWSFYTLDNFSAMLPLIHMISLRDYQSLSL